MINNTFPFLIGSGFYSSIESYDKCQQFFEVWSVNTPFPAVIVDNSDIPLKIVGRDDIRVIRTNNLGHVHQFLHLDTPKLGGWSMSWILPALVAYSDHKDFIYKEQDCLAFCDWIDIIYEEAEDNKAEVIHGPGTNMSCEQSLFWIKWESIPKFIGAYCSIEQGDGVKLPEDKFTQLANIPGNPYHICLTSLKSGRGRPLPNQGAWYAQQFTKEELSDTLSRCPLVPTTPNI
jgi:hypothetical protein